jgi:outer membrane protein
MKKIVLFLFLTVGFLSINAQKIGYVDTEYILKNIPEYQEAQKELDELSKQWKDQIDRQQEAIDKAYQDFEAEEILLTERMKNKRREEILELEQRLKDLKKEKFGVEGELFKKRKELIKPIQEDIYKAAQQTANIGRYSIIFDKASRGLIMIYTNPKYDKSDDVLRRMGYSPGDER